STSAAHTVVNCYPYVCGGILPVAIYCTSFSTDAATTVIYTLSLHDALPIFRRGREDRPPRGAAHARAGRDLHGLRAEVERHVDRSEEHTSELQSRENLVCRLLLEKKKITRQRIYHARTTKHRMPRNSLTSSR